MITKKIPNILLVLLSALMMSLAWLNTGHFQPWVTFISDYCAFWALFFLMCYGFINIENRIKIPKISYFLCVISIIPLLQYFFGKIYFFNTAFLSSIYIFCFFVCVILSYNISSIPDKKEKFITCFCYLIFLSSIAVSLIAIIQWLGVSSKIAGVLEVSGPRPYANFAQPNHMSTFLLIGLLSLIYLFEQNKINKIIMIFFSFLILFSVVLSQSRTGFVTFFILIFYLLYHMKKNTEINVKYLILISVFFTFSTIFLKKIGFFVHEKLNLSVLTTESMASRLSSENERIDILKIFFDSALKQPLLGYGWGQGAASQFYNRLPS